MGAPGPARVDRPHVRSAAALSFTSAGISLPFNVAVSVPGTPEPRRISHASSCEILCSPRLTSGPACCGGLRNHRVERSPVKQPLRAKALYSDGIPPEDALFR